MHHDQPAVSFAQHIKPLFRAKDHSSMIFAFDLWDYDDVRANAESILSRVQQGDMPCDGPWSSEQIDQFVRWVATGRHP